MGPFEKARRKAAYGLKRTLHYMAPVAKVAKAATDVFATVQKPTPMGVLNSASSAIGTLADLIDTGEELPGYVIHTAFQPEAIAEALRAAGFRQVKATKTKADDPSGKLLGREEFFYPDNKTDERIRVTSGGQVYFWQDYDDPLEPGGPARIELVRRGFDAVLPPVVQLHKSETEGERSLVRPAALTSLTPSDVPDILARTKALLAVRPGPRSILLEGRPGIGKTTAAQAIAREAGLGRVVLLDSFFISRGLGEQKLQLLSPGVIVMDDIDKHSAALPAFEAIRRATRLLILTANNGAFDRVLDGALSRPARIDEVFTITSRVHKRPPFDRLPDAVWERVSQWPHAYLNELELRLTATPDQLRLKDLVSRLSKRTRSFDGVMGDESAADDLPWEPDEFPTD